MQFTKLPLCWLSYSGKTHADGALRLRAERFGKCARGSAGTVTREINPPGPPIMTVSIPNYLLPIPGKGTRTIR